MGKYYHRFETQADMEAVRYSENYTEPWLSVVEGGRLDYNIGTNGHEFVNLGLPSGTLWARYDVGVELEYAYWGSQYLWGHTSMWTNYTSSPTWTDYRFGTSANSMTKYNASDGKTVLDLEDDAVHVAWGGKWRMPTKEDCIELYQNCTCTTIRINPDQTTYKQAKFTSKINGNYIIFPSETFSIWTSSVSVYSTYQYAYAFRQYSESNKYYIDVANALRYYKKQVRGVIKP